MWLTADEALKVLGIKPQTLYANVSRGRIRARPDPADSRRSLYNGGDVDRLARRGQGRRPTEAVAAEAIRWGDPVLDTRLSTVTEGRLFYRGVDAAYLADTADLEEIAQLLWPTDLRPELTREAASGSLFAALAARADSDPPSFGRAVASLRRDAAAALSAVGSAICGNGEGPLHARLGAHWQREDATDDLRCALVLLADHELNASTFAARVAVSTGASFAAGALAGLATLSGPLHGGAAWALQGLLRRAGEAGAGIAVRECLAEGRHLPAFGHPLYPQGDPRARALLGRLELPALHAELLAEAASATGELPNIDFALAALTATYDLPPAAPMQVFALARSVGWLAHMLEQAETGTLIRPRARYVGAPPAAAA